MRERPKVIWPHRGQASVTQISQLWILHFFFFFCRASYGIAHQMSAVFLLPHWGACWLHNSCRHIMAVSGWLTVITLWLCLFFFCKMAIAQSQHFFSQKWMCREEFWKLLCYLSGARWFTAMNQHTWQGYLIGLPISHLHLWSVVGKKRKRQCLVWAITKRALSSPSGHQHGTVDLFQTIPLELLSPDAPARVNLLCEHRVIVSELQKHFCVSERGETGWLVSVFNDVSAAVEFWKLQVEIFPFEAKADLGYVSSLSPWQ